MVPEKKVPEKKVPGKMVLGKTILARPISGDLFPWRFFFPGDLFSADFFYFLRGFFAGDFFSTGNFYPGFFFRGPFFGVFFSAYHRWLYIWVIPAQIELAVTLTILDFFPCNMLKGIPKNQRTRSFRFFEKILGLKSPQKLLPLVEVIFSVSFCVMNIVRLWTTLGYGYVFFYSCLIFSSQFMCIILLFMWFLFLDFFIFTIFLNFCTLVYKYYYM